MTQLTVERAPRRTRHHLDMAVGLTPAERAAKGKAARAEVPRDSHAVFDPVPDRPDPIAPPTPTRTSVTIKPWSTPSPKDGSWPSKACELGGW
jgi:hypothetical protein